MADLFINISLTKWTKRPFYLQTRADRGESVEGVLRRATGLYDAITEGGIDVEFLRENVGAYLTEAFSTGEPRCFAQTYGDTDPNGEDWRLHIDGITQAEVDRRESLMPDFSKRPSRSDGLVRMVRMDEELGLLEIEVPGK